MLEAWQAGERAFEDPKGKFSGLAGRCGGGRGLGSTGGVPRGVQTQVLLLRWGVSVCAVGCMLGPPEESPAR